MPKSAVEIEIDQSRLERMLGDLSDHSEQEQIDRRVYFRELFRLPHELLRLQDWVQYHRLIAKLPGR